MVLHSDRAIVVAIFQAGRERDSFIQVCTRKGWLACALHDVRLTIFQSPGEQLVEMAATLSHFHKGGMYQDKAHQPMGQGVRIIAIPVEQFQLFFRLVIKTFYVSDYPL